MAHLEKGITIGRRSRLTCKLIRQIETLLLGGLSQRVVYASLGIPQTTYFRWLRQGRDELESGLAKSKRSLRADLAESVEQATALGEVHALRPGPLQRGVSQHLLQA